MSRYAFALIVLLAAGCQKKFPIPEKTFVSVYAHVAFIKAAAKDSASAAAQIHALLDERRITMAQMVEQLKHYADDPDTYRRVLQEIADTLKTLKE